METDIKVNSETEILSTPQDDIDSSKSDMDDVEMDEINDEIFALPQISRLKYMPDDYNDPLISPLSSPLSALDINEDESHKDILQDFNNRDKKVQELILLNKQDFEKIRQSFDSSEEEWKRFLRVLYAKSEIVPDREWINTICEFIDSSNPLLLKFQELIDNNPQVDGANEEYTFNLYCPVPYQILENDDDGYSPSYSSTAMSSRRESRDDDGRFKDVDIKTIRNFPEKLSDFENAYPNFFTNVKTSFGQENRRLINHLQEDVVNTYNSEFTNDDSLDSILSGDYDDDDFELRADVEEHRQAYEDSELYDSFVRIFFTSRRMMPDDVWEEAVCECLNDWPHLMTQLKDIIAYEISNESIL